jgi:putative colanic acid biosynthesis acetyltransferase WcaF
MEKQIDYLIEDQNIVDLGIYNNSWYSHGNSLIVRIVWILLSRIFINTSFPVPTFLKVSLLRLFGAKVGKNCVIRNNVKIKYPWYLEMGSNVWIGESVWIDNLVLVKIEDNVCVSQGAYIFTGNHDYKKRTFDLIVSEVMLCKGVWIGAKAIVGPGVNCFENSILTAGSATFNDLDSGGIYQGCPAVFKRSRKKIMKC